MRLFGYSRDGENNELLELDEASICFDNPEEAAEFARFAMKCAEQMQSDGLDYDHEHFAGGEIPDITIERLLVPTIDVV